MPHYQLGEVELICKEDGIIAGLDVFKRVFTILDETTEVTFHCKDGDAVKKGEKLGLIRGDIRVLQSGERTEERNLIVDLGGTVVDVYVWHKVYGRMHAPLNIYSRAQVKQFIDGARTGKSTELMAVTGGYHYHTIRAESESVLDQIEKALSEKGFLAPGE